MNHPRDGDHAALNRQRGRVVQHGRGLRVRFALRLLWGKFLAGSALRPPDTGGGGGLAVKAERGQLKAPASTASHEPVLGLRSAREHGQTRSAPQSRLPLGPAPGPHGTALRGMLRLRHSTRVRRPVPHQPKRGARLYGVNCCKPAQKPCARLPAHARWQRGRSGTAIPSTGSATKRQATRRHARTSGNWASKKTRRGRWSSNKLGSSPAHGWGKCGSDLPHYASSVAAPAALDCLLLSFIVLLVAQSEATNVMIILGLTSTMSSHVRNTTQPILRATLMMYLALDSRSSAVGAGPC